jgi:hypothetical protein
MAETPVAALEERSRKLVENAQAALERGNLDYVLEACAEVLESAPGCVVVRRLQRAAQLRQLRNKNRLLSKVAGWWGALPWVIWKRPAAENWNGAERWIARDPTSVMALTLLGEAALERGMPETAVFAFQAVQEVEPENAKNLVALGGAWLAVGNAAEALRCANRVLAAQPMDGAAQELMRVASIAQTVADGRWEEPTTFREKLR